VFVRASLHMRREEKPTRCHWMVYCTYNMLNMFRIFLCKSSGDPDYMCVITAYGVLEDQHPSFRTQSRLPCTWPPTTSNQGIAHHRR